MKTTEKRGFTLLELTVVIAVIGLLAMTALPSIIGLFRSSSDAQAYNMVTAALVSARAEAMQSGNWTAVHFEQGLNPANYSGQRFPLVEGDNARAYWIATCSLVRSSTGGWFVPAENHQPRRLPGHMAAGEIGQRFVDSTTGDYTLSGINGDLSACAAYKDFTTFSVMFDPMGSVLRWSPSSDNPMFRNGTGTLFYSSTADKQSVIWPAEQAPEAGAVGLTLFDADQLEKSKDRTKFLNDNGQLIGINRYTGQLFPRK